jgi:uncharacterized RmlC-like cupin family protein
MTRPIVVHPHEATAGLPTPGMERRQFFDLDGRWAGWVRTDAGAAGGWHHHATNDTYVYVLAGALTVESGHGGRESVIGGPGDFMFIPAQTIHREITGADADVEAFIVRVGGAPQVVNVDGPESPS